MLEELKWGDLGIGRSKQLATVVYKSVGGGGTPIYWLYGYVPLEKVWFSSHLVW